MRTQCVIGIQWGDEGKGKIVDCLSADADVVVRYQGGGNAGHTVVNGDEKFVLHLVPSGILHPGARCVIGNGVVVDPAQLLDELSALRARGIATEGRLLLSDRAHVVLPYHKALDALAETQKGEGKIGTTGRGIGPCYMDKFARIGIRMGEFCRPERAEPLLRRNLAEKNRWITAIYGGTAIPEGEFLRTSLEQGRQLAPTVGDTVAYVNEAIDRGERVLFEGAQGSLLDIDLGTYPYVTSSNSDACGVSSGAGVSPKRVGMVLGVLKAYTTRVGGGPFPTELPKDLGDRLRERGQEYGATTGRPRRCGWADAVALRYAVQVNGVDALAVMKLDVLDEFPEVRVAVAYRIGGKETTHFPGDLDALAAAEPVYETFPGWKAVTSEARAMSDLPSNARRYLDFLQARCGVPISMVSVGARRMEVIRC